MRRRKRRHRLIQMLPRRWRPRPPPARHPSVHTPVASCWCWYLSHWPSWRTATGGQTTAQTDRPRHRRSSSPRARSPDSPRHPRAWCQETTLRPHRRPPSRPPRQPQPPPRPPQHRHSLHQRPRQTRQRPPRLPLRRGPRQTHRRQQRHLPRRRPPKRQPRPRQHHLARSQPVSAPSSLPSRCPPRQHLPRTQRRQRTDPKAQPAASRKLAPPTGADRAASQEPGASLDAE